MIERWWDIAPSGRRWKPWRWVVYDYEREFRGRCWTEKGARKLGYRVYENLPRSRR